MFTNETENFFGLNEVESRFASIADTGKKKSKHNKKIEGTRIYLENIGSPSFLFLDFQERLSDSFHAYQRRVAYYHGER